MSTIKITCLVNNNTRRTSSFWGEHGLSFYVETSNGSFFFDTGQTPDVLQRNLSILDIDTHNTRTIVLSHGHYDHTGGLQWLAGTLDHPMIYADPDIFIEKYAIRNDVKKSIGIPIKRKEMEKIAGFHLSKDAIDIFPGVMVSGRIPRTNIYETNDPELFTLRKADDPDSIIPDIMLDDRCIILNSSRGAIVLLGCCHAGIINTLTYAQQYSTGNLYTIIGGTHMASISEKRRSYTTARLKHEFSPEYLYLNHCTGDETLMHLHHELGGNVLPCPVGTVIEA